MTFIVPRRVTHGSPFKINETWRIAALPLQENAGTRFDLYGLANFTEAAGTLGSAAGPSAAVPRALQGDSGGTDYLSLPASFGTDVLDIDNKWGAGMWVYLDSKASDAVFFSQWDTTAGNNRALVILYDTSDDDFRYLTDSDGVGGSSHNLLAGVGPVSTATWYYVYAGYDSGTKYFQVDNNTQVSASSSIYGSSAATVCIGRNQDGGQCAARIANLVLWGSSMSVLQQATIDDIYNKGGETLIPGTGWQI